MRRQELIGGIVGTLLSGLGAGLQTNEILQAISLVITIIGGMITFIILPLLNWYRNSKKDGKISIDEAAKGAETLKEGLDKTKEALDEERKEDNGKIH